MGHVTLRTLPETDIQLKGVKDMTTTVATLRRGIELVDLDKGTPVPGGFVFQLADELPPSHVTDRFGKAVVFNHMLDLQTLHTYDLVLTYEVRRELVLVVSPSISNTLMDTRNPEACLCTVLRPLLFLGMSPLCLCQLLLIFRKELGVAVAMPITGGDHAHDPQIKSDHFGGDWEWLDVLFHKEGYEVAICCVFAHGHRGRLGSFWQRARPVDIEGLFHFRQGESLPIPLKGGASILSRLIGALLLEGGIHSTTLKEIEKGFIKMAQGLLSWNRRDFIEPSMIVLLLEEREGSRHLSIVPAFSILIIQVSAGTQRPVVDVAYTAKRLRECVLLFLGGIEAVLVRFLLPHVLHCNMYRVKLQREKGGRRFLPCLKAGSPCRVMMNRRTGKERHSNAIS